MQKLLIISCLWAIAACPGYAFVYPFATSLRSPIRKESLSDASSENAASPATTPTGGGTATIPNEIFNLVKSIVGAGVLSLPYGIATLGSSPSAALPAVILMTLLGICSGYGFGLIGRVCGLTQRASYTAAWAASVSPQTPWLPALAVTSKTLCAKAAAAPYVPKTGAANCVA